ncbi:MAG: 16S rRNA processing protein RimM [Oscillospiraceae bacterium]|nr:16S rRNA processing protein RimM [Oscillospiraceae bacterium]
MKQIYIDAGEIVTTHGVRGEVKVMTWLDSPEMLCEFDRCRIDGEEYIIESCRVQKSCNLVKLQGIDTMEDAQAMRGKTLQLYREDMDDEVIFAADLIGVEVLSEGVVIGTITDVLSYPGNSVYVIGNATGKDAYMIPAVKEFILSTDIEKNEMHVKLIEGMRSDEN